MCELCHFLWFVIRNPREQYTLLLLFSCWFTSNSLWPHGLQHDRLPCSSLSPRVCSDSCPLSRWCYQTISFSVVLFSSCLQSFPASGSFPVNRLFASGGRSIGASASASVLPMSIQGWFPLDVTGFTPLKAKGLSRVLSSTTIWRHQFFGAQPSLWSSSHIRTWLLEKPWLWLHPFVAKWYVCFLIHCLGLSAFLPRSMCLLISWLQSPSTVILDPRKICHLFHFFPFYLPWSDGTRCHDIYIFFIFSFKPAFLYSSFTHIKRLLSTSSLLAIHWRRQIDLMVQIW